MEDIKDVNSSSFKSASWKRLSPMWTLTHDWWASVYEIREKGETYLEKFKKEPADKYTRRKWNSVPINYFKDQIESLGGTVFRTDPRPTEAQPVMADLFDDIDLLGNSLHAFLLEAFKRGSLRDGNGAFFIEAPVFETVIGEDGKPVTPTRADRAGDRPWWIFYEASQIINAQEITVNGRTVLQNVTIETITNEPAGRFGEKEVKRHRVYTRGEPKATYEILVEVETNGKKTMAQESAGSLATSEIPLILFDNLTADPPLMALLLLNILHYNKTSDFDDWCHVATVPEKIYKFDDKNDADAFTEQRKQTISVGMATAVWGEHSDVKFCEVSGNGMEITTGRYQEVEQQMLAIGGGMFKPSEVAPKSATEVMDSAGLRESKLAAYTRKFENAVEKALYITAEIINAIQGAKTINLDAQEASKLKLKIDYSRLTFSVEQMRLFSELVAQGNMSKKTFLELLEKVMEMPEGWSVDAEIARLKADKLKEPVVIPPVERLNGEAVN